MIITYMLIVFFHLFIYFFDSGLLLFSWSITCCCSSLHITLCHAFNVMPSVNAISSLNVQYDLISYGNSCLLWDHLLYCILLAVVGGHLWSSLGLALI